MRFALLYVEPLFSLQHHLIEGTATSLGYQLGWWNWNCSRTLRNILKKSVRRGPQQVRSPQCQRRLDVQFLKNFQLWWCWISTAHYRWCLAACTTFYDTYLPPKFNHSVIAIPHVDCYWKGFVVTKERHKHDVVACNKPRSPAGHESTDIFMSIFFGTVKPEAWFFLLRNLVLMHIVTIWHFRLFHNSAIHDYNLWHTAQRLWCMPI